MVKPIDFSTLMASSVHDLKNIIAAINQAHESLLAQLPEPLQQSSEAHLIKRESLRLNALLIQLLSMYKLEYGQLRVQGEYHRIDDLFEDLLNRHSDMIGFLNIRLQIDLEDPDLEGFFDLNLIATILDNALGNALRHCGSTIRLHGKFHDEGIVLEVSDDGPGYPAGMSGLIRDHKASGIDRETGSTGLGLYFAANILALHDQPERPARLQLSNGQGLPGACLHLWIPLPALL